MLVDIYRLQELNGMNNTNKISIAIWCVVDRASLFNVEK